ncbi:MAG: Mpo1-like protein [Oryzihumus sp.]
MPKPTCDCPASYTTYEEFWPYYVAMHSRASTRWAHLVGTTLGAATAAHGLVRLRKPSWLLLWPLMGYGAAWPSHFFIEQNNPATFGHPAWSLRGDFEMIRYMLTGRDADLSRIAASWWTEHTHQAAAEPAARPELRVG